MSQEVDSRVVEMRFDNANFEKNTKQTISTIDRLMAVSYTHLRAHET